MKTVIQDAIFVSESQRSFTDQASGEVREYYKALFTQDGSEPLEIAISQDLAGSFERFGVYRLVLDVNSYNRRFSVRVVEAEVV